MDRTQSDRAKPAHRQRRTHLHYGPVVWIVLLLACWFVLADWRVLPDAISNTMASLL
jgi:hypothetical protein